MADKKARAVKTTVVFDPAGSAEPIKMVLRQEVLR